MKLIVGLGNPGRLYRSTRHNFGFLVVEALAEKYRLKLDEESYSSRWGKGLLKRKSVVLAKPQTYVNLSGRAVGRLIKKFRLDICDLLIVLDDVNLSWGSMRLRKRGSAGGHNGLASIIGSLGTDVFPRLRVGISGGGKKELAGYVLAQFNRRQKKELASLIDLAVKAVEVFIQDGIDTAMNRFNRLTG